MQRHSLQSYQIKHAYQIIRLTSLGVSQDTALHPSHSTWGKAGQNLGVISVGRLAVADITYPLGAPHPNPCYAHILLK
jgi:hypothetical protein